MRERLLTLAGLVAGVLLSVTAATLHYRVHRGGGAELLAEVEHVSVSAGWSILLYAAMVAGVLANYLYNAASQQAAAGQPFSGAAQLVGTLKTAPRLWMALAVSPFLFHAIHAISGAAPDSAAAVFFAFQNGFFWQAVFAGFQQQKADAQPAAVAA